MLTDGIGMRTPARAVRRERRRWSVWRAQGGLARYAQAVLVAWLTAAAPIPVPVLVLVIIVRYSPRRIHMRNIEIHIRIHIHMDTNHINKDKNKMLLKKYRLYCPLYYIIN